MRKLTQVHEKYHKISKINKVNIPEFGDWVLGNAVSYIFIYLLYIQKIGYLYVNIADYSITYTLISPFAYFFLQDFF